MICAAALSPVLFDSQDDPGQGAKEAAPQLNLAVARLFKPGTPPF